MLVNILLGSFTALAIITTIWSLAVTFSPHTSPTVRKDAKEVFRTAWKTAVAAVLITLVRAYASGALDALQSALKQSP